MMKTLCIASSFAEQDGDAEFAVFRFTFGIPGFDDDLIPRVIGCLGAALLVANHVAAGAYTTAAQVRLEGNTCTLPVHLPVSSPIKHTI